MDKSHPGGLTDWEMRTARSIDVNPTGQESTARETERNSRLDFELSVGVLSSPSSDGSQL